MRAASRLLGPVADMARHALFIAGQDPLRDEGIVYAERLPTGGRRGRRGGIGMLGVPHIFGGGCGNWRARGGFRRR